MRRLVHDATVPSLRPVRRRGLRGIHCQFSQLSRGTSHSRYLEALTKRPAMVEMGMRLLQEERCSNVSRTPLLLKGRREVETVG
jgi:hypothetical protein